MPDPSRETVKRRSGLMGLAVVLVIGIVGLIASRVRDVGPTEVLGPVSGADAIRAEIAAKGLQPVLEDLAFATKRQMVDSETELLRVVAEPGVLHYSYQVSTLAAQAGALLEPAVRQNTCDNAVSLALMDGGATLVMDYNGPDGVRVVSVSMVKQDCGA